MLVGCPQGCIGQLLLHLILCTDIWELDLVGAPLGPEHCVCLRRVTDCGQHALLVEVVLRDRSGVHIRLVVLPWFFGVGHLGSVARPEAALLLPTKSKLRVIVGVGRRQRCGMRCGVHLRIHVVGIHVMHAALDAVLALLVLRHGELFVEGISILEDWRGLYGVVLTAL